MVKQLAIGLAVKFRTHEFQTCKNTRGCLPPWVYLIVNSKYTKSITMRKAALSKEVDRDGLRDAFRTALIHALAGKPRGVQARIAQFAGVSTGQLTNIIKGIRPGNEAIRRQMALFLGYEYEDFLSLGHSLVAKQSKKAKSGKTATGAATPTLSSEDAQVLEKVHAILLKKGPKAKALKAFISAYK